MIIEINYKALHWDNHQGGSGKPFDGRLLRTISDRSTLAEVYDYAVRELELENMKVRTLIGDFRLVNIVLDSCHHPD